MVRLDCINLDENDNESPHQGPIDNVCLLCELMSNWEIPRFSEALLGRDGDWQVGWS
jgi:hypothetical protein